MSETREAFAEAAESLVGIRFRLFGRDPAYGLDCVGLVAAALARSGRSSGATSFFCGPARPNTISPSRPLPT